MTQGDESDRHRRDGAQDPDGRGAADGGPGRGALDPGLYLVATPIGAARDITLRALDVLGAADMLVAEDTRVLRRLMEIHGIPLGRRPLTSYHDHNGAAQRPRLLAALAEGARIAYASDAGTPLIADPGYRLARDAAEAGHRVVPVPGASAVLAALSVAGLPTDRFMFAGFPPVKAKARQEWLDELLEVPATLVLYETGRRLAATLAEIAARGGGAREAAICRELTKRFEEARRGTVATLARDMAEATPRGEIVLVLGPPVVAAADPEMLAEALRAALAHAPLREASAEVARAFGVGKRDVYQLGLSLKDR